ncbi:SDR family oxidoreductase [Streptomyces sp. NBC_01142]|uniref:SDR family NAD(P)-dependent oxidoreductase n=1 Tax=Streptomyces sp. NBC_01142 TaxID=2975865 RepID=UPI00224DCEA5|nr:SDR family oxidoreductase [Streptomyces sp. NBC_01142]MCX4825873.1 SDR family oxidoreductase [Streptomyces sp. NBC_01142]
MLDGRVAIVTGAGRGLGRAYARAMAAAGAAVVVNDLDADVASETVDAITGAGGSAVTQVGAVGSAEFADALVKRAIDEFGRLDVMVTNAGALRDRTLRNTTDEDFDLVVTSHLRGTFTCGRAAAARFREQGDGGRLVLVGSPAGQRASFGQTAYSASKGAIVAMTRTWALELAKIDVTVNAIVPTALTRMVATVPRIGDLVAQVDSGQPIPEGARRQGLGSADDVAPVIVYLASRESAGVTGQAIAAGGDRIALWTHPGAVPPERLDDVLGERALRRRVRGPSAGFQARAARPRSHRKNLTRSPPSTTPQTPQPEHEGRHEPWPHSHGFAQAPPGVGPRPGHHLELPACRHHGRIGPL